MPHRHEKKLLEKAIRKTVTLLEKKYPGREVVLLTDREELACTACRQIREPAELDRPVDQIILIPYFANDEDYAEALSEIKKIGAAFYALPLYHPAASYRHRDRLAETALRRVERDVLIHGLKHFDENDFQNLMQAIEITREIEGDYLEIGVFTGTSGLAALYYMEAAGIYRRSYFMDTFEGFTYPEALESMDLHWRGGHRLSGPEANLKRVSDLFSRFSLPVRIIRGNICRVPLPEAIQAIAVCNVDVDLYDAVSAALQKVAPCISRHGIIVAEDSGHTPALGGALLATREFLQSPAGKAFIPVYLESGQTFLIKK